MNTIWHNGTFKDESAAILTASDRALRGDGVFDTALSINGRIAQGTQHFNRLIKHANTLNIKISATEKDLLETAQELLIENEFTKSRYAINTVITRGRSARGLSIAKDFHPQIIMRASPLPEEFPPIKAIIAQNMRRNEGSPLSQIKSINYGDNILAMIEAEKAGANEAIMLNNAGKMACATVGNIFITISGTLYTPPLSDGAMSGITRALLLKHHGAQEKSLTPDDLKTADALYITNSIRGMAAVTSLNGSPLPKAALNIPKDFHE